MKIERRQLEQAVEASIIEKDQVDKLWQFLNQQASESPHFSITHVLYYFGGMVAIGAMSLFMTIAWEQFGGWAILLLSLVYAAIGLGLCEYFQKQKHLAIPAGIMATFVVVLTPLAVFGIQDILGYWSDSTHYHDFHRYIDWRWIIMELATLASGAIMVWRYRYPFLLMPVAVTLWYMSMDLTPFLFQNDDFYWQMRKLVSMYFGLLIVGLAFWVDIRSRHGKDFAFWLYIFGVMAFWGGMSSMDSNSEINKLIYLCINLLMIFFGAIIFRRVFVVFGALGCSGYLGHLAYSVFEDSLMFPLLLTLIGLGVIYLGILWQRHESEFSHKLRAILPKPLRELIENRH